MYSAAFLIFSAPVRLWGRALSGSTQLIPNVQCGFFDFQRACPPLGESAVRINAVNP
ncbi:hypothetical protein SAMN06265375_10340 [Muriicola jejuensis]|nr:hypothetical protein SAMN06265375_10340 [Muriicola jejuensis]